jgi:hypothetical protein
VVVAPSAADIFDGALPSLSVDVPVRRRGPVPAFVSVSRVRCVATLVFFAGGALFFQFPLWAFVLFPVAAVLVQCLARHDGARWSIWSVLLAAYLAEATLPYTWPGRFAVCLLLIGPFVFYIGSILRAI